MRVIRLVLSCAKEGGGVGVIGAIFGSSVWMLPFRNPRYVSGVTDISRFFSFLRIILDYCHAYRRLNIGMLSVLTTELEFVCFMGASRVSFHHSQPHLYHLIPFRSTGRSREFKKKKKKRKATRRTNVN